MSEVDRRLASALREQLTRRPEGARRVGWKVGAGDRESIGGEIAVGRLISATLLEAGSTYRGGGADLHADAEVALELGEEHTMAGYGVALEIVDLAGTDGAEAVVAGNVFHRAVAFGPVRQTLPRGTEGTLFVNGDLRATAPAPNDFADKVAAVARLLAAVGEQLQAGDRIIAGSVVQVPIEAGDEVAAGLSEFDRVRLSIA